MIRGFLIGLCVGCGLTSALFGASGAAILLAIATALSIQLARSYPTLPRRKP